ncbi:ATP-dependent zinc protease [Marinicella sediminis]|uniref:ATP-dependent zinc protease n=1 Tax=Marinicella sediminis TaxID=1792834 RepID=A0ABV7J9R3_9GAMM|nr:RimK/LysX family protein [Marinicella sediminis]
MSEKKKELQVGWKEYAVLPELGVDRIHVKIDTGAKTSAIHSSKHKVFSRDGQQWVRFVLAPYQDDDDTTIECECPVKDQRTVTSSNGHKSERIVIETQMIMGHIERKIEVTLVCRRKMKFRMLLGRQAMKNMAVHPDRSHLTTQPKRRK